MLPVAEAMGLIQKIYKSLCHLGAIKQIKLIKRLKHWLPGYLLCYHSLDRNEWCPNTPLIGRLDSKFIFISWLKMLVSQRGKTRKKFASSLVSKFEPVCSPYTMGLPTVYVELWFGRRYPLHSEFLYLGHRYLWLYKKQTSSNWVRKMGPVEWNSMF